MAYLYNIIIQQIIPVQNNIDECHKYNVEQKHPEPEIRSV